MRRCQSVWSNWKDNVQALAGRSHRREHLHTLTEVADERHDGHLLHEALDLAELHHKAVLVRQAVQRLALLLELPQDFDLVLGGLEAHQALHEVHRESSQVKAGRQVTETCMTVWKSTSFGKSRLNLQPPPDGTCPKLFGFTSYIHLKKAHRKLSERGDKTLKVIGQTFWLPH